MTKLILSGQKASGVAAPAVRVLLCRRLGSMGPTGHPSRASELGEGSVLCKTPFAALGKELLLCVQSFILTSQFNVLQRKSKMKPPPGSVGCTRASQAGGSKGSFKVGSL